MDKEYCVYEHVFPNDKRYIGISCDPLKRWRNGKGYETQGKIANAIFRYGWENIRHNIIIDGVSKKSAEKIEKFLIAELNTIEDGYNTAIGGENIRATFLSEEVLAFIRGAKKYPQLKEFGVVVLMADKDRYDKEKSGFWNEAARAVKIKHGIYSPTSLDGCISFWHCITQYMGLYSLMQQGRDISGWSEIPPIIEGRRTDDA